MTDLQLWECRAIDPALEEPVEGPFRFRLHRKAEILSAALVEPGRAIEPAEPAEERLVADETPQHVKNGRALVVDERAEHARLAADVAAAGSQGHGTLVGL